MAQCISELCDDIGLQIDIQNESHNGVDQANVLVRPIRSQPDNEFLLQTHLDTCDPGSYALWTKTGANPFNCSIYKDTIFGLGVANAKLDFLCKLQAIREIIKTVPRDFSKATSWKLPFVLAGTFGEETGMAGAIRLIRKKKISAKMALVGEPTDLRPVWAGKGVVTVEIEVPFSEAEIDYRIQHDNESGTTTQSRVFVGKAAHSSVPQLGDNAITKMLDYLGRLPDGIAVMEMEGGTSATTIPAHAVLEFDTVGTLRDSIAKKISSIEQAVRDVEADFRNHPDSNFVPSEPTLNIGLIRSYEDHVKLSGCCRFPPSVSHEMYENWMDMIRKACAQVGATFRVTDYKQPFKTSVESELFKICREELLKNGLEGNGATQSVANEANVFSRFGIECVVIGPGVGFGNSHAPNEYVKMEQLNKAIQFYRSVLERICL